MAEWGIASDEARQSALQLLRQNVVPAAGGSGHSSESQNRPELGVEETPPSPG